MESYRNECTEEDEGIKKRKKRQMCPQCKTGRTKMFKSSCPPCVPPLRCLGKNRMEKTTRARRRLQTGARDNKAKQGLGLHTPTPTPPPPPDTSLLTARTEPPSPSPAALHSNRRGEPRTAAEKKIRWFGGTSSRIKAEAERMCAERMHGVGRSVGPGRGWFLFSSSCSSSLNHVNKGLDHVTGRRPLPRDTIWLRQHDAKFVYFQVFY